MVLDGEQWHRSMSQAFEGAVVEIEVCHLDFALIERIGIDGEVMIVRCDLDPSTSLLAHGMITSMMSKLQLVRFAAEREPD